MSKSEKREPLTSKQAIAMLPKKEMIHSFCQVGAVLLGADWYRDSVIEFIKNGKPELAGEQATRLEHRLAVTVRKEVMFFETKKKKNE